MTKILVVDDEEMLRERMKKLLELEDYEVLLAENGLRGLELFQAKRPDLVVTDLKMPGMDGIELLEQIKATDTDVEVFVITGHGGIESAIKALKSGAFDYVTKPIDFDELCINLKRALEKQALKRQLKFQQTQLVQAAKLTAVGQLGAGVAHEMNQPLMAIASYMESLLMNKVIASEVPLKEKLLKLKDQFNRLSTIVKRMHDYAGNRHGELVMENISRPLLDGFLLFKQQLMDHNIAAVSQIEEGLPKVFIDRYQIQDIVINFIVNARDAVDEKFKQEAGGEITAVAKKLKNGAAVLAGIIDNGIPVKPGTEQDIFNPFFTTKAPGKGTGLGLSVSYGIMKTHKGSIAFAPLSNGRKIFYFLLPVNDAHELIEDVTLAGEIKELLDSL